MILYFGDDQNFVDRMNSHYSSNSSYEELFAEKEIFRGENIISKMISKRPTAMIFDFSYSNEKNHEVFTKINYLKKNKVFKGVPLIGIFKNKGELNKLSYLFNIGLNYPFIRGTDERILFADIHYFCFELNAGFSKFAKAKFKGLPYQIKHLAHIYGFTKETILIESDVSFNTDDLKSLELRLMEEDTSLDLRAEKTFEVGISSSYLNRSEFEIPFLGPWDDPGSDLIHKDSFETWIEESTEHLKQKNGRILLITERPEDFVLAGELAVQCNFDIYVSDSFEESKEYLSAYNFDVIYYRLSKEDDPFQGENNFENLYRLTNAIKNKSRDLKTVFVAFNSPSKSNALKKAIEYDHIVAVGNELSSNQLGSFTNLFQEKGLKLSCKTGCYSLNNNESRAKILLDVEITSLTEHEITFTSKENLPMYSIVTIDVPTELTVIIVPPINNLESNHQSHHYMGFLTGGSEQDAELLRSFVNRAIIKGLEVFSLEGIEEELSELDPSEIINNSDTTEAIEEQVPKVVKEVKNNIKRKTNNNGKSKL
ncbi:MAG: hypothetical protein CME70_19775 [Halobacteriovorax sp.]|nr:hypothetical protein [Halobacteriovorax sp.]|tara:strand:+ start:17671 stop:19287 length:1617 start_codon:yes stop_codon:yes gene_type:complete